MRILHNFLFPSFRGEKNIRNLIILTSKIIVCFNNFDFSDDLQQQKSLLPLK